MSVLRPSLFRGKVAIVTGGGSGIGKAIASELASLDCSVVIASRDGEKLERAADELRELHGGECQISPIACNIRDESAVNSLMSSTLERYGRIDYLVNNGGGQFPCPTGLMPSKGWNAVIDTNLTGAFTCCREAYNAGEMSVNGGAIVNIIADMFNGFPGMVRV
jgi:peroxisomal trans-2-enoyl-CoA reductase